VLVQICPHIDIQMTPCSQHLEAIGVDVANRCKDNETLESEHDAFSFSERLTRIDARDNTNHCLPAPTLYTDSSTTSFQFISAPLRRALLTNEQSQTTTDQAQSKTNSFSA